MVRSPSLHPASSTATTVGSTCDGPRLVLSIQGTRSRIPLRRQCEDHGVRLFVALTPPEEVIEALRTIIEAPHELAPGLRWSRPEQWHLTLVFLGEVGNEVVQELTGQLNRAA